MNLEWFYLFQLAFGLFSVIHTFFVPPTIIGKGKIKISYRKTMFILGIGFIILSLFNIFR